MLELSFFFFFLFIFKRISSVASSLNFMSKQLLAPEFPVHPHPWAEGLGGPGAEVTALAANWPTASLRTFVFYSQREQVLASDKKMHMFCKQSEWPETQGKGWSQRLFIAAGARLCAMLVKWTALRRQATPWLPGFPFAQEDLSSEAHAPLTPTLGCLTLFCFPPEPGASLKWDQCWKKGVITVLCSWK